MLIWSNLNTVVHILIPDFPLITPTWPQSQEPLLLGTHLLTFGVTIKIIWPHVLPKHDIVIQVNEFLGQPFDAMNVTFNSWWTKGRQVAQIPKNILWTEKYKLEKGWMRGIFLFFFWFWKEGRQMEELKEGGNGGEEGEGNEIREK